MIPWRDGPYHPQGNAPDIIEVVLAKGGQCAFFGARQGPEIPEPLGQSGNLSPHLPDGTADLLDLLVDERGQTSLHEVGSSVEYLAALCPINMHYVSVRMFGRINCTLDVQGIAAGHQIAVHVL